MPGSLTRKEFIRLSAGVATLAASGRIHLFGGHGKGAVTVRLGGPLFSKYEDPEGWIDALKRKGFRAAYCPVDNTTPGEAVKAYKLAAERADIVISEVGVWENTISPDEEQRKHAIEKCVAGLRLADEIGATCCVNTSGSRNKDNWAGPHKDNLTQDTFDLVVETTRRIIDEVKPQNSFFTLEAMPWAFPYSPDSYLDLIKAVGRKKFGVHLDPVNMITSPQIYFSNAEMIRECFSKLGPHIRSCHAKDTIIREDIYTIHLDEVRPGLGTLDYSLFLRELSGLDNVPLMMEHLEKEEDYTLAADYIRSIGKKTGIGI
jgi:sugar phosphate isomerase/epimerase